MTNSQPASPNFGFLAPHDSQLVRLGTLAERYFADDPNTCLIKLRQFGELLAQLVAAKAGMYVYDERQIDLLRRLRDKNIVVGKVYRLFDELRFVGNKANHALEDDSRTALSNLKYARELGVWFHKYTTKQRNFEPGAFVPPPNPKQETWALKEELAKLQEELNASRSKAELAQIKAQQEAQLRISAEELAYDAEAAKVEALNHLATIQRLAETQSPQKIQETIQEAQIAGDKVDIDERETRRLIDAQLREAGWEADSENFTYANGTRPQKNKNMAIAEFPTENGRADYALFAGLQIVAVVEAKRRSKDVAADIEQAKRYSRGFKIPSLKQNSNATQIEYFTAGAWGEFKVPFVFATNGRDFLQQLRTKSGIWFCDLRRTQNLSRPLTTWYSPQGLLDLLEQDIELAHQKLQQEGFNYNLELREYQILAIEKIEATLSEDIRSILVAMATGTGKTKTCIALVYRLLKTKRFRRVLFLVDRSALGEQAVNAFKDTRMESLQTFADIFDIKEPGEGAPDRDTKVQIATVQSFVKRLFYPSDDATIPTADTYDCIVVDECHRGYLLDRELSETELTFRDYNDYISKYRRVLDHFDAVKIGLTATPALHTTEIFGDPVYTYSYRKAVIEGWLIDHEPPIRITTRLSQSGISWQAGEAMEYFDPATGEVDLVHAPDEVTIEIEQFNKQVITTEFNRVVCETLAPEIDPSMPEKTLIFCVTNDHADIVVDQLKQALEKEYGSVDDDAVIKITGNADKPLHLIRRFKNEANPKIAVTVDLLTTGIDVPPICNLVFIRRVNSRILYEQMLGRATRRCDNINKEVFRIFDAVDLYNAIAPFNQMKPVVVDPNITFTQLVDELDKERNAVASQDIVDQLLAKLQRKHHSISDTNSQNIETAAGMPLDDMVEHLRQASPQEVKQWFSQRKALSEALPKVIAQMLDAKDGGRKPILISHHDDEVISIERGYGNAEQPEDYLDNFQTFLRENINKIPALMVVTQRPRNLTRAQLKELRMLLDQAGYKETYLQEAWRHFTNQDIAASIIGFIRQAAIGDALVPYSQRVDKAINKILAAQNWTTPQRKWLERIGKQLKVETVVDKEAFNTGEFKAQGGFNRINKVFQGKLETILVQINDALWQDVG
ncbi:type I restriction-modification system endonuclease [Calothrix sp. CCY 0018]|uniref:type I restriction-modification system endonuclease n=1 Tax=Calothrix sp. CCY 0018 TaxID=3103864 RepID=UPI0039C5C8C8